MKSEEKESAAEDFLMLKSEIFQLQYSEKFDAELKKYIALGNKTRFFIFKYLEQQELCSCVMSKLFDIKEATHSHHLKILREAGLIEGIRKRLFTVYRTVNL